jgi:transcriptional regulator with XRE-family HTH domain
MSKSSRPNTPPDRTVKPRLITKVQAREEFARRLRKLILDRGWRQSDLARASGLPRNAISIYVRGVSLPEDDNLNALASAFGLKPADLIPHFSESIVRDSSELEFSVVPGDPKSARLRINRTVSTSLAIKIMGLIEAEDAVQTTD